MPPVADAKSRGQNGQFCDPNVAGKYQIPMAEFVLLPHVKNPTYSRFGLEELRQLRWDILALADSFGWTDKPAQYIPPARDNKAVHWVSPTGSSRRQKELSELLGKKA